ncbi:MAG TPA: molybdopterin cofactor-binding domain-containing protein [Acidimicrobiales bacterium]|nr:molybdopterin cofactor-binding domain-containing protein [Acidimicrobiales bacterium]
MTTLEGPTPRASHISRRRFLGYLVAGPTLAVAAPFGFDAFTHQGPHADAAGLPSPQATDAYDLSDLLTDAAMPTSSLITIVVNSNGTVSFALPRAEVGQGITTAVAMTIAEEMNLAVDQVEITLADARPELVWNQLTGGSNSMHAIFTPVRVAAALAQGQLLEAASLELSIPVASSSPTPVLSVHLTEGRSRSASWHRWRRCRIRSRPASS